MKKSRKVIGLLGAGVLLVLAVLLLYTVGRRLETSGQSQQRGELAQTEQEQTCVVDGITYRKRSDIMSILVMGVDCDSTQQSDSPFEGGQADFQRLIVLDAAHGTVQQLKIDRDTITDVVMLGYLGSPIGTQKMQISLAHGFGDGKEESCEYAQQAVEALLGEDTVDFYLAMNLDGIPTLNDLVGGVTVTLEDDFSAMDPAMVQGGYPDTARQTGRIFCPQPHEHWRGHQRGAHGPSGSLSGAAAYTAARAAWAGKAAHRRGAGCNGRLYGHRYAARAHDQRDLGSAGLHGGTGACTGRGT